MDMLIIRCRQRARLATELVDRWKVDHLQAMMACDVDELLAECSEVGRLVKRVWLKIILAPLQFGGAVGSSKTMFTNSDVTIISLSLLFREVWSDFRGHLRFAPK